MASGTPVVAIGDQRFAGSGGEAAVLVNPENVFDIARGIREVLTDAGLRARLIDKGKIHAARFSWERNAREVMGIYREVMWRRDAGGEALVRKVFLIVAGGLAGLAPNQPGMQHGVEIAFDDTVHIADGEFGAVILDHAIGREHVAADLAAEIDLEF